MLVGGGGDAERSITNIMVYMETCATQTGRVNRFDGETREKRGHHIQHLCVYLYSIYIRHMQCSENYVSADCLLVHLKMYICGNDECLPGVSAPESRQALWAIHLYSIYMHIVLVWSGDSDPWWGMSRKTTAIYVDAQTRRVWANMKNHIDLTHLHLCCKKGCGNNYVCMLELFNMKYTYLFLCVFIIGCIFSYVKCYS